MRLTGLQVVSVDPDRTISGQNAFPGQNIPQPGLRSGYLAVVSIVFCVGASCCVARQENKNNFKITSFSSNNSKDLF